MDELSWSAGLVGVGTAITGFVIWLAKNQFSNFFKIKELTLQNLLSGRNRQPEPHVACHVGEFVLFRGDGQGGFYRVPINIELTRGILCFKLTRRRTRTRLLPASSRWRDLT